MADLWQLALLKKSVAEWNKQRRPVAPEDIVAYRMAMGQRRFQIDLSGADLRNADLTGADLMGADLTGADLTGADLTGADLYRATLADATLWRANLTRAILWSANLTSVDLREATLIDASLMISGLSGANLTGANLTGANFGPGRPRRHHGGVTSRNGANLTDANLTDANLARTDFRKATLLGATLLRADLTFAILSQARLAGANLTKARLIGADLTGTNLTSTDLTEANLTGAILTDADFRGAILTGVQRNRVLLNTQAHPERSSSSTNWLSLVETVGSDVLVTAATLASIIQGFDVIERRWREHKKKQQSASQTAPNTSQQMQASDSEIVGITLVLDDGSHHSFQRWVSDPDALRAYIEAFSEPTSKVKPLQVIFQKQKGRALRIDVTEGGENNQQLNVILSYLESHPQP